MTSPTYSALSLGYYECSFLPPPTGVAMDYTTKDVEAAFPSCGVYEKDLAVQHVEDIAVCEASIYHVDSQAERRSVSPCSCA